MQNIQKHEIKWLHACNDLAQIFSTCAKRQYASVVIGKNKRLIGFGYNGSPPGMAHCTDGACPRMQENSLSGSHYDNCIAQHAEAGALLWSDVSLRQGATLVVNGSPCMGCAKLIASSGIYRIVYIRDESYAELSKVEEFLSSLGIELASLECICSSCTAQYTK